MNVLELWRRFTGGGADGLVRELESICDALLAESGEYASTALAREAVARWHALDEAGREKFFDVLARYSPPEARLKEAAAAYQAAPTSDNLIRLLELPTEVQDLVRGGALTMGHARALLGLSDDVDRLKVAERVVREELSVRAVEELVREGAETPKRRTTPRKPPQVMALESELRAILGTKVQIQDRRGKGRILIEYYSPEEFERLLAQLRGERGFGLPQA